MSLSQQSQVVLLLTVHLGKSSGGQPSDGQPNQSTPLTVLEWARLNQELDRRNIDVSALLKGDPKTLLDGWEDKKVTPDRLEHLINRGAALGFALEKWHRASLWALTEFDQNYPKKLRQRLEHKAPPVLFGCGNKALLEAEAIAVVGSRDASPEDLEFSEQLGRTTAAQGFSVVSGTARGVDERAMLGALEAEGTATGVMANNLLRAATSAKFRKYIQAGDLLLISPYNPEARFTVGHAMERNAYIYALAKAAVVVNCAKGKGGTWNGVSSYLKSVEKSGGDAIPIWVRKNGDPKSGNAELAKKGAHELPSKLPEIAELLEHSENRDGSSGAELRRDAELLPREKPRQKEPTLFQV